MSASRTEGQPMAFGSPDDLVAVLDRVDDGITVQDASGRLVYANEAGARIVGFPRAEAMLEAETAEILAAFELFDEHGKPMSADELPGRQALAGENGAPRIVRSRIRATGEVRYSRVSARAVRDADGRITHVVNTFHDVTDLKRNEESLAFLVEAASLLATSLDYGETLRHVAQLAVPAMADWCVVDIGEIGTVPDRVATWHRDPEKRAVADEFQRRYPAVPPDPATQELLRRGEPIVTDITDEMLEAAAALPGRGPEYLEAIRKLTPRQALVVPLAVGDRTIGVITFLFAESGRRFSPDDVAYARLLARPAALAVENARLYHSLEEAVRVRDTFLQMAAHELLTPITVVRGYSQSLGRLIERRRQEGGATPDGLVSIEAQRLADTTRRLDAGTERLTRLVHDLLDLSRIQRGTLELVRQPTDLGAVLRDVAESARQQQQEGRYPASIAIEMSVPDEPIVGDWDPLRLEQVFYNVIDNAVKYSPGDGRVEIGVSVADGTARVEVADVGLGIPTNMLTAIFEPFTRAPNVGKEGFPGFGMGLAICREIVERHGGQITAMSEGPGTGTRVVIELPSEASPP